jgi:uracil-DNA glycosylase
MTVDTISKLETAFGDWAEPLNTVFDSHYFTKLLKELSLMYDKYSDYYSPKKDKIFSTFLQCKYDDVRVVILGQDPYFDNNLATGLSFANPIGTRYLSPALDTIFNTVIPKDWTYDITLKKWAEQGVLLLNTALTVECGKPNSNLVLWKPFIAMVLEHISTHKNHTIFCLWGNVAQSMSKFIDETKHTILCFEHPATACRDQRDWECDHFEVINSILNDEIIW